MNYNAEHKDKTKLPSPSGDSASRLDLVLLPNNALLLELANRTKEQLTLAKGGRRRSTGERDGFYHLKWQKAKCTS